MKCRGVRFGRSSPGFRVGGRWFLLFLAMSLHCVMTRAGNVPELVRALDVYQNQVEAIAQDTAQAMETVDKAYLAALDRLEDAFRERGELHGVLAIRSEKNRYRATPDTGVAKVTPLPDEVKQLAERHAQRRREVDREEAAKLETLIQHYLGFLNNLKRDLTRQDRVDDALTVAQTIADVRKSDAFSKVRAARADGPQADWYAVAERPSVSLSERLQAIRINEFRHTLFDPFRPVNGLVDALHPHGIGVKIEAERLPLGSVSHDSDGKPTFRRQFGSEFQSPRYMRELHLRRTTALDALRAICATFGLGYRFEEDTVVLINPDNPRAVWACDSLMAEAVAGLFAADNPAAVARFRDGKVRITGAVTSLSRSVAGHTIAVLYGERPVRIELTDLDDETQLQGLLSAFRQIQEDERRYGQTSRGGRPAVRRMGEDSLMTTSPPSGPVVVLSAVSEYQTQMGQTIVFTGGRHMTWQRVHRYTP